MDPTSPIISHSLLVDTPETIYGPPDLIMNSSSTTISELLTDTPSLQKEQEEAVFPPIFTVLPTTKLEEEPNPFEESFEVATEPVEKHTLNNTRSNALEKQPTRKKSRKSSSNTMEDEEKRKNFLERNRIAVIQAALKCRQRKKQWLQDLQARVEYLANENEQYHLQANALREELIQLRGLLIAHKDCPVNPSATQIALSRLSSFMSTTNQPQQQQQQQ